MANMAKNYFKLMVEIAIGSLAVKMFRHHKSLVDPSKSQISWLAQCDIKTNRLLH